MISADPLAALCAETYTKPADVSRAGLHLCFTPAYGGQIVAALRGSADLQDWILNFRQTDIRSIKYPKLDLMPEGFADDVLDAYQEIRKGLAGYERIVLTGHSRGGAQAQILAALLASDGVAVDQVATYGAPRVGGLGGNLEGVGRCDWYVNGNDPVPLEPFWALHPRPEAQRFIGAKRILVPACIADHLIGAYQASLAAAPAAT